MTNKEKLIQLFSEIPPDWIQIKKILESFPLTKMELAELAEYLADDCAVEYAYALEPSIKDVTLDTMHSPYLLDSLKILMDYGLDPSLPNDEAMQLFPYIDMPNVGAEAMRLYLEHGADPNDRTDTADPRSLFDYLTSSITFDAYEEKHKVQCWWVLMAYGARFEDGDLPLKMLNDNKIEMFKDFELFDYRIEPLPGEATGYGHWTMHIYNKLTKEEVAQY